MKIAVVLLVILLCIDWPLFAQSPDGQDDRDGLAFFERQVRPILVDQCYACHSRQGRQHAGLLLDSRQSVLRGGDNGPAIIPGDVDQSRLVLAIRHEGETSMPPDSKLSDEQIGVLEQWVRLGAPFPADQPPVDAMIERLIQAKRHWAFQPLQSVEPPTVNDSDWLKNEIDGYVLAQLEAVGLQPSPPADRATLIRRVALDLTGLLPSPEEVETFVADCSPTAYEDLVDRLLASSHYGERWGRHWLDLARYADSSGFHNDLDRPWAWKYRDYVIDSFNEDKPYDQFVAEQLAGDEVPWASTTTWIATGFGRNGPSNDDNTGKTEVALKQYRADQLDDVISTTATVFLGVTLGCARCHDHKTDPFTTQDYYRLLAIFNGTDEFGEPPSNAKSEAKEAKRAADPSRWIQARVETKVQVPPTYVMRRGNAANLGELVEPAAPTVLVDQPLSFPQPDEGKSSLRRLTLAQWITSKENGLTWRVLANRIWQYHFGRGLVSTPSNFGLLGGSPSHPELLDYLALQLMAHGGRWKPLHKQIVMSATYQQTSAHTPMDSVSQDARAWLAGFPVRRIEAEVLRDSILVASGNLNRRFAGPGVKPRVPDELIPASQRNKWPQINQEQPEHWRRSVYVYTKRQLLLPMLELFDAPTSTDSCALRSESVVPTQALVLMNDQFVEDQARFLAERAWRESIGSDPSHRMRAAIDRMLRLTAVDNHTSQMHATAYHFVLQRSASTAGQRAADGDAESTAPIDALTDLAHVIFNSSQFVYIQ